MTNAELVALLREARDFMRQAATSRGPCPDCTECDHRDAIIAKADAALAAHDAVLPSEEDVEWESGTDYEGKTFASAQVKDVAIEVNGWDRAGTRFYWRIFSTLDEEGRADTLEEAKSAAIAAARGMR